jgi:hypothetical protein
MKGIWEVKLGLVLGRRRGYMGFEVDKVDFGSDLACVYYCSMFGWGLVSGRTWSEFVGEIPKISLLMEFSSWNYLWTCADTDLEHLDG